MIDWHLEIETNEIIELDMKVEELIFKLYAKMLQGETVIFFFVSWEKAQLLLLEFKLAFKMFFFILTVA